MSTRAHTYMERVTAGERVRLPRQHDWHTVASRSPGMLHGIRLTFADGGSVTALPSTPVEVRQS